MKTFIKIILIIGIFLLSGCAAVEEAYLSLQTDKTSAKGVVESEVVPKKEDTTKVEAAETSVEEPKVAIITNVVTPPEPITLPNEIILDVPLLNQMDAPRLYNGCEVTSLAMVLNYSGIAVSKNELAQKIERVPLNYADGTKGNPNVGFVGNMEDGPGLGVYHEPIFKLAQSYMGSKAEDLTKQPFEIVLEKVGQGMPVWVITTTSFAPTTEMKTWSTPQGPVDVTFKMHSVVITGYDQESIYINDPYGSKNRKVNKANFIKAWEQMGSQAVVINK